jgi:uracil-DNA glycosylase family 4
MIPDPAPTVRQLLAFYLEAGVDCALAEEPVDRLAEPDAMPAAGQPAQPRPAAKPALRTAPAFIQRQIELVNPDVLVTLGNPSTQTLLSTREGIMRTRGRWFDYNTGTRTIRALATFHPAYLLRSPSYKRMSWQDLRAIAKALTAA